MANLQYIISGEDMKIANLSNERENCSRVTVGGGMLFLMDLKHWLALSVDKGSL